MIFVVVILTFRRFMGQDLIYSNTFDGRYRDAMKSRLDVADFLDYPSVKDRIDAVVDATKAERDNVAAATAASAADPTTDGASAAGGDGAGATAGAGDRGATPSAEQTPSAAEPEVTTGFASLSESDQLYWNKYINKHINTYVKLVPDQKTQALLVSALKECPSISLQGDMAGLVVYHFDVKKFGEPLTRPDLRVTPLQDKNYHRLVRAVLQARHTGPDDVVAPLGPGAVAVVIDGGRKGDAPLHAATCLIRNPCAIPVMPLGLQSKQSTTKWNATCPS